MDLPQNQEKTQEWLTQVTPPEGKNMKNNPMHNGTKQTNYSCPKITPTKQVSRLLGNTKQVNRPLKNAR